MGSALLFKSPGRAFFMAMILASEGHGVKWTPKDPMIIMTSAGQVEVRKLSSENPGVTLGHWESAKEIDMNIKEW